MTLFGPVSAPAHYRCEREGYRPDLPPQLPLAFDHEEPFSRLRVAGEALAVSQGFFTAIVREAAATP